MIALTSLAAVALSVTPVAQTTASGDSLRVSTAWLAQHLQDRNLVLFQVGTREEYDAGHIPGAQFITLQEISAPRGSGLVLELPSVATIDSVLEARGVSDDSRVIVYWGSDWFTPTARVFLTLDWIGLRGRVAILDGGLPAWRREGRALTADAPVIARGSFTPRPHHDVVVDAGWVAGRLRQPGVTILDARTPEYYHGTAQNQSGRPGHIPGAVSVPFTTLADDSIGIEPLATLRQRFDAAGVKSGDLVVAYCHIGQQASLVYFAARLLGYATRLYDGSFTEWTTLTQYPVEK